MSRKVNDTEKKEILNLFVNGTKIKDISKIYKFTIPTITRILKNSLGNEEFIKLKENTNSKSNKPNLNKFEKIDQEEIIHKSPSVDNEDSQVNPELQKGIKNSNRLNEKDNFPQDSIFVELAPLDHKIDLLKQKDLSSISILEVDLPKIVYIIVDDKIELETKLLKDYPEWQFLSQEDLNRKTIKIYFDLKSAKNDASKNNKVIKVPNTKVFEIVSPILMSRGISRIVTPDQLIAL